MTQFTYDSAKISLIKVQNSHITNHFYVCNRYIKTHAWIIYIVIHWVGNPRHKTGKWVLIDKVLRSCDYSVMCPLYAQQKKQKKTKLAKNNNRAAEPQQLQQQNKNKHSEHNNKTQQVVSHALYLCSTATETATAAAKKALFAPCA